MMNQDAVNDESVDRILMALPMTPSSQELCEVAYIEELTLWEATEGRWPRDQFEVRRSGELVDRYQLARDAEEAYQRLSKRAASAAFIEAYTEHMKRVES
jgi:hypothetical protein